MSHVLEKSNSARPSPFAPSAAQKLPDVGSRMRTWLRQESPLLWWCSVAGLVLSLGLHALPAWWQKANEPATTVASAPPVVETLDPRWSSLPAPRLNADLRALVELAQAMGLTVERAQVRRTDAPSPLRVEEVELETTAPYPLLRRFLARSLNEQPHLAVKRLRLDRESEDAPGEPSVRSQLSLRLHYREDAAP